MLFDEMNKAVNEAKNTLRVADNFVGTMARMISGKLRSGNVSGYVLAELKKELKDFNMHTNTWKEKQ